MNRKHLIKTLMIVLTIVSLTPGCAPPQVVESPATPSPDLGGPSPESPTLTVRRSTPPATRVEVEVRDKRLRARVVKPPFARNGKSLINI